MAAGPDVNRDLRSAYAELNRLGERVENQTRYIDVLERRLQASLEQAGLVSVTIDISDPISPLGGARDVDDGCASPRWRPPAPANAEIETADDWWPRVQLPERALVPNAGWRNYSLNGHVEKVVGVSVCGLSRTMLEGIIGSVIDQQSILRDFIPVFLTDSTDFDIFRKYGVVFEYLPGPERQAACEGTRSWAQYAADRRRLVELKWGLDHVICIGQSEFGIIPSDRLALEQAPPARDVVAAECGPEPDAVDPVPGVPAAMPDQPMLEEALQGPLSASGEPAGGPAPHRGVHATAGYDSRRFWVSRHEELSGDIRSVGNRGKSVAENELGYRDRNEGLRRFISREIRDVSGRSAIEFGCGIGMIAEGLLPLGLDYTGIDISERALEDARQRCPNGRFLQADITHFQTETRHDIALISSVLCHMVDEADWRRVIGTMCSVVKPRGVVILAEDLPLVEPVRHENYVMHRTFEETCAAFRDLGFNLDRARSRPPFHIARPRPGGAQADA